MECSCKVYTPLEEKIMQEQVGKDEIAPYWKGKTFWEEITATMPEETRRITYDPENMFDNFMYQSSVSGCQVYLDKNN